MRKPGGRRLPKIWLGTIAGALTMLASLHLAHASEPWKQAIATVFWVGEVGSDDNGHIPNLKSAWDQHWLEHYGGVDDPSDRCGYQPCTFMPLENPFYVALPYDDMTEGGARKSAASIIPWKAGAARKSSLKNRWIAIRANGVTCYAQWQDVGPFESDDAAYVFGDAAEPRNKQGEAAGIDLSPAVRDCLQVPSVAQVSWRHVDDTAVPDGPWRKVVTTRPGP